MICASCKADTPDASDSCEKCGWCLSRLPDGTLLAGRYEIEGLLGRGGMGTVHRANDRILDETVAIKVMQAHLGATPEIAQRFRSEIKIARKVRHPNVCAIHEYGEVDGLRYISMEFVDGVNLRQMIRQQGALEPDHGFDVSLQILAGLEAVHDLGIIHRDLKTPNIMIDGAGRVRLMDFGLAKQRGVTEGGLGTLLDHVMGTPEFMSPEQAKGERADFPADIYAVGVVLYEIFSGELPFKGAPVDVMLKHVHEAPPFEGEAVKRIPPSVVPILQKALSKAASDRYATAQGMASALGQARLAAPASDPGDSVLTSLVASIPPASAASLGSIAMTAAAADTGIFGPLEAPVSDADGSAAVKARIDALVKALESPEAATRWGAARALGESGPVAREASPALIAALHDPDFWVGEAAAVALRKITGETEAPRERRNRGPREAPSVAPALQSLIDRMRDPASRWMATVALGEMGSEARAAVPHLIEALDDADAQVRWDAAKTLGKIGPAAGSAVPALAALVNDPGDALVRRHAVTALGQIGKNAKGAVPSLIHVLREPSTDLHLKAAEALVRIGVAAVPALIEAMKDTDQACRVRAAGTLRRIAGGHGTIDGAASPRPRPSA
jgi:serine/threonine protein kinase